MVTYLLAPICLPAELEDEILLWAAILAPKAALELTLVSRRVHSIINPLIYNTVVLDSSARHVINLGRVQKFLRTLTMKPAAFFERTVKSLCITCAVGADVAMQVLAVCSGVRDLACWVKFDDREAIVPLLHRMPLRSLNIELGTFNTVLSPLCRARGAEGEGEPVTVRQAAVSSCSWATTLRHLELVYWDAPPALADLRALPALTQVNLFWGKDGPYPEAISTAIESCAQLELLRVLVYDPENEMDNGELHEDNRVRRCVPASPAVKMWTNYLDGTAPGCWTT
ncbi:hypothetical protein BD626DRAFT_436222 [Schizophyllum amplum]|uniref:F-box domain-containing protein n=1 Tax=Schizophyllum amplum TaxID=97359 RepID=A0A550C5I0_9AGAR|nr:hypothetical protein BD626DRAFT_436222 [Auriculariopsis ampla]